VVLWQGDGDDARAGVRGELDGEAAHPPVAPTTSKRWPFSRSSASTAKSAAMPASGVAPGALTPTSGSIHGP
jgi:hypothetical protein